MSLLFGSCPTPIPPPPLAPRCTVCGFRNCLGGFSCSVQRQKYLEMLRSQAINNSLYAVSVRPLSPYASLPVHRALTVSSTIKISPTSQPLPSGGVKVEDLIGWRIWRVKHDHLWSFSADYAWMPGGVSEGKPGDYDTAGIWAFKEKRRAFQKAVESGGPFVWGSVRLWGHVVEHADGYRTSKARIVSIDGIVGGATGAIQQVTLTNLCRLYGVPEAKLPPPLIPDREPMYVTRYVTLPAPPMLPTVELPTPPPISQTAESKPDAPWPVIGVLIGLFLAMLILIQFK